MEIEIIWLPPDTSVVRGQSRGRIGRGCLEPQAQGVYGQHQKVRNFYGDRKRRDQKSVRVWRSFCGGGADTFSCRSAGPSGQMAACCLKRSQGLGVRETWAQPGLLCSPVLCF